MTDPVAAARTLVDHFMDTVYSPIAPWRDLLAEAIAAYTAQAVKAERERLKALNPDTLWRDVQGTLA